VSEQRSTNLGLTWDAHAGIYDDGGEEKLLYNCSTEELRSDLEAMLAPEAFTAEDETDWECFCFAVREAKHKRHVARRKYFDAL